MRGVVSKRHLHRKGKAFDLRCEIREGLIEFLRRNHPESLPKVRSVEGDEPKAPRRKSPEGGTIAGSEHEKGDNLQVFIQAKNPTAPSS